MASNSPYAEIIITSITFDNLSKIYDSASTGLKWDCLFVLPFWLKNWWQTFKNDSGLMILMLHADSQPIGIAPLMSDGRTARFIGSEDVCDYHDMVAAPGQFDVFYTNLLSYLKNQGISFLELGPVRKDSSVFSQLSGCSVYDGHTINCEPAGVAYELDLPLTWETYLESLHKKQRHEIRRKLRRLNEAGRIGFQVIQNPNHVMEILNEFFLLFQMSRQDKAEFLTQRIRSFFQVLFQYLAQRGILKLYRISINQQTAAITICFDYADTLYLYNNGYNPAFANLSVGTISKVMSIQNAIINQKIRFNFLKGDEPYKRYLGGQKTPLYRFNITLH